MKQNAYKIELRDFTESPRPYGNVQGRSTFSKITDHINQLFNVSLIRISFADIEEADISYSREAVVSFAKYYKGEKGIYITNVENDDIIENLHFACIAKNQPLLVWANNDYKILGEPLSLPNLTLLEIVLKKRIATTASVAKELNISVQNASTRLKKLVDDGYILRKEVSAESGGKEYIYTPVKDSD
ncbi:MAG: winged helix-turn-helix domain-containing protein [Moraxellaceae bacterium]|nr:MAG: winged helix-turn-helix domain-containing protein [Moraxellaceae bacterium]